MLRFTAEQVSALGPAAMCPDGDSLYITNNAWMLAITGVEHHIPLEVLRLIAFAPEGCLTNWGVLTAKELFPEEGKYIPARGNKSADIYETDYKYRRVTAESCRGLVERYTDCLWGDFYRLDQLFAAGRVRTKYLRSNTSNERRKFSTEPAAEHYVFDLDGRVLILKASWFKVFYEMNFEINCPTNPNGPPDAIGLYKKDITPDVFGFLAPIRESESKKSRDGRELYLDPTVVSWYTPEHGVQQLQDWSSYTPGDDTPATLQVKQNASHKLLEGVAILRWHDLTDTQIDELYAAGRKAGLRKRAQEIIAARACKTESAQWDRRVREEELEMLELIEEELGEVFDKTALLKLKETG